MKHQSTSVKNQRRLMKTMEINEHKRNINENEKWDKVYSRPDSNPQSPPEEGSASSIRPTAIHRLAKRLGSSYAHRFRSGQMAPHACRSTWLSERNVMVLGI